MIQEEARVSDVASSDANAYLEWVFDVSVGRGASDIHFERTGDVLIVRMRVDGVMFALKVPDSNCVLPMLASLKLLAGLDSTEVRSPQEGVIRKVVRERMVEFRVSVLPTQHGESVVLRVLDGRYRNWHLNDLNLPEAVQQSLHVFTQKAHGLLLVTGPTGSGKTTTLYSLLRTMHAPSRKLITVEDPVECVIPGVTQVAVKHDQGLGFARCVRSFLRHDPDVIMVGEIRDPETAHVAVQAALTGHRVLSSLHAGDAVSVPGRLMDLGVEPHLVAAALAGVLAQRLVRRCCPDCSGGRGSSSACGRCHGAGYCGRLGLFEYLEIDDAMRCLIIERASSLQMRAAAAKMQSLHEEGVRLVREGKTTQEEIAGVLGEYWGSIDDALYLSRH